VFDELEQLPPDPILGLMAQCRADANPNKIDLGVGIYMNAEGRAPVMAAVHEAERRLLDCEQTKAYIGPLGDPAYDALITQLIYGEDSAAVSDGRIVAIQTPGGCGGLRVAAEMIKRGNPKARVWVSDPSWPIHRPLLGATGLEFRDYPYYDRAAHGIDFSAMHDTLQQAAPGDVVLLHGCCHNPTGADLSLEQWAALRDLMLNNGLVPLVDIAYQGLAEDVEQDAAGIRLLAESMPEMIVASSCSKNFALYRERTGAVTFLSSSARVAERVSTQAVAAIRQLYSMPPAHGAAVVALVLSDSALRESWLDELGQMRARMNSMRALLAERLRDNPSGRSFEFIAEQRGLFSYLGISKEELTRLREEFSVYIVGDTRINIAGLNPNNIDYLVDCLHKVLAPG
jgi:aspartate aminotransferase